MFFILKKRRVITPIGSLILFLLILSKLSALCYSRYLGGPLSMLFCWRSAI